MKQTLVLCLAAVALAAVVSAAGAPGGGDGGASVSRAKRGFRLGAADRFSHGFGKRAELLPGRETELMTSSELVDMLVDRPQLLHSFVRKYVDTDGDGIITREELFSSSDSRR